MPPVGAAIGGLFGLFGGGAITIGSVATALAKVAAGFGLSYAAKALAGKPDDLLGTGDKPIGVRADIQVGDSLPRSMIFGRWVTPGSAIFCRTWGETNNTPHAYLVQVIRLSDLPIERVVEVYVDGAKVTYGDGGQGPRGYAIPEYRKDSKDYLWIKIKEGGQVTADDYLTTKWTSGDRRWTDQHIGIGVAYAIVTSRYNEKLFSGRPECRFVINGARLYDLTKDTTAGGSGAHRWDQPGTWEFTQNPMVMIYNLMRGVRYKGKWVYGLQTVSPAQLPFSSWAAAINECNLLVQNREGTYDPQYQAGAEISWDTEVGHEIAEFLKTCNGRIADCGGVYKPKVGPAASSGAAVFSFTDDHLLTSDEHEFAMFPSLDQVINGIDATFIAGGDGWTEKALPPRREPTYELADDGRENIADITYAHVRHKAQAQRLTKSILNESRRFRRHVIVLGPQAYVLEPLDFVSWTSTRNGYANKLFRVESVADRNNGDQVLGIQEVDPADYNWTPSEEALIPDGVQIIDRPPVQTMPGFSAVGIFSAGAGGRQLPAIRVSWAAMDLDDVDKVTFEVRVTGTTAVVVTDVMTRPELGTYDIVAGINGATAYQVRAIFQDVDRHRDFEWSAWLGVVTPDTKVVSNQIESSLISLIHAGSAGGKLITEQLVGVPGFQSLYRITLYGTGPTPVAVGEYLYVSAEGIPGVIFDAANFAIGPLSSVPANAASKGFVFPFAVDGTGTTKLKRGHIEVLQAGQIDSEAITAEKIKGGTITADKFKGAEISQIYPSNLSGASNRVTIKQKGGVVLLGNFKYDIKHDDNLKVAIVNLNSGNSIIGSQWQMKPSADCDGIAVTVGLDIKGNGDVTYELKRMGGSSDAKMSNPRLIAMRVYD